MRRASSHQQRKFRRNARHPRVSSMQSPLPWTCLYMHNCRFSGAAHSCAAPSSWPSLSTQQPPHCTTTMHNTTRGITAHLGAPAARAVRGRPLEVPRHASMAAAVSSSGRGSSSTRHQACLHMPGAWPLRIQAPRSTRPPRLAHTLGRRGPSGPLQEVAPPTPLRGGGGSGSGGGDCDGGGR
jgi:hypothetical protein